MLADARPEWMDVRQVLPLAATGRALDNQNPPQPAPPEEGPAVLRRPGLRAGWHLNLPTGPPIKMRVMMVVRLREECVVAVGEQSKTPVLIIVPFAIGPRCVMSS
jgi:hypothetical protein